MMIDDDDGDEIGDIVVVINCYYDMM